MLFEIGIAEGADILACRALRGIVEQCFLEEERMRRVGDDQPRDAVRVLERGHPRDRTTPIVAGQSEAIDPEMVGEREHVGDDLVSGRSEEPTSELQSLMRISYAVYSLTKKKKQ